MLERLSVSYSEPSQRLRRVVEAPRRCLTSRAASRAKARARASSRDDGGVGRFFFTARLRRSSSRPRDPLPGRSRTPTREASDGEPQRSEGAGG